jgi:two-component system, OmpR family, heavy metal sensor histidine kinase CusS
MRRPTLPRLTLTARLTLLYTGGSASVLLGLGWLTATAVNAHFVELDQATLRGKTQQIQALSHQSASLAEFNARLRDVLHGHDGLYVSVEAAHQTVYATPGLVTPVPAHWQVRHLRLEAPTLAPGALTVSAALDPVHHTHFMALFQKTLGLYVAMATLVSGLLGWLASRNGLSPLRAMKARAQAVSGHRLDERMPVDAVPVELADLARTLNDMLVRLQNDFERLSAFSADLAHELRTPISNLLTQTQVMLAQKRTGDEYRNALASNSEELQRLARMVSDMLLLAKTENGLALPHPETIHLDTEAAALVDFYEALAADKQLRLTVEGAGCVQGDRLMVRRALSNLLSNAIRHSPVQGQVRVRIRTTPQGGEVCVENHGDAIDPGALPRLFDRFYRADAARRHPHSDGAGLGLAITRAIMLAHGGSVTVASDRTGTRFSLVFAHPPPA